MESTRSYTMPGTEVSVLFDVDVVVAGGGFPGVCAAVAAARTGAKVAIVEQDGLLGGQAAEIYTFGLDASFGDRGRQIIKGLPWEIIQRTVALGGSDPVWENVDSEALDRQGYDGALAPLGMDANWKQHAWLDRNNFRHVLQMMCEEEDVTVLLESPIIGTMLEGDKVTGVIAQGVFEAFGVAGSVVVDTTPTAVVAARAGRPFPHPMAYFGTHPHVCNVEIEPLVEYACANPDDVEVGPGKEPGITPEQVMERIERGVPFLLKGFTKTRERAIAEDPVFEAVGWSEEGDTRFFYDGDGRGTHWMQTYRWRNAELDDPLFLSKTLLEGRRLQWLTHEMYRRFVPGFENARMEDIHPHIARALHIAKEPGGFTDYDITWDDIMSGGSYREDCIMRVLGHPQKGQPLDGWMLSYAALLPKGFEGLLVTGKPACRFIHYHGTVGAVGHAAGVAGGLAAVAKKAPRALDAADVREELKKQGAVVE